MDQPTVVSGGLNPGASTDLTAIGTLAIAVSVGLGGAIVILISNIILWYLVIIKCRAGKSYYFNRKKKTGKSLIEAH